MTHINKIKELITSEKNAASKHLFDAAVNANTPKIEEISKEIQILNKLESILNKNESNNAEKEHKQKKETNKEPQKKNPIVEEETTVMSISDNLTNKRPVSIEMDGKTEIVNSFRSRTETACRLANSKNHSKFAALADNPNVNGDKHKYFATNSNDMTDPVMIGSGRSAIYVDVAKLAINNLYFLKKALTELGYDISTIKVAIDPNYSRKPREKK